MARRHRRSARHAAPASSPPRNTLHHRSLHCEQLEDRRLLAVVTVDTELDLVDLNDGKTSLREAIFATNTVPGADEIRFDFGHDGPGTILLTQGELRITDSLRIVGSGASLLTIDASGSDPTRSMAGGDGSRLFNVDDGVSSTAINVVIEGMALTGGDSASPGGAIRSLENLSVVNAKLKNNAANGGAGAIYAEAAGAGQVLLVACQIEDNRGWGLGGGVRIHLRNSATAQIDDCEFSRNRSSQVSASGGGLYVALSGQSELSVRESAFAQNKTDGTSGDGGGASILNSGRGAIEFDGNSFLENSTHGTGAEGGGAYISAGVGEIMFVGNRLEGNSTKGTSAEGGGVCIVSNYASVILLNNQFVHNSTNGNGAQGGGAYVSNHGTGLREISGNSFWGNATKGTGGQGGGLYVKDSGMGQVRIATNQFIGNSSTGNQVQGGGIAVWKSSGEVQVIANLVEGNFAKGTAQAGAGIYVSTSNGGVAFVSENTLKQNISPILDSRTGAGIAVQSSVGSSAFVTNNVVEGSSRGIEARSAGLIEITDNLVTRNQGVGVILAADPQGVIHCSRNAVTLNRGGVVLSAASGGTVYFNDAFIAANVSSSVGGGIYASVFSGGNVEIRNCTVVNNRAESANLQVHGGGIAISNLGGQFLLVQCTVSSNSATGDGGGIWISSTSANGVEAQSQVSHTTVSENASDANGDGVGVGGGVNVAAGLLKVDHSIVAGNHDPSLQAPDLRANAIKASFSLIGNNASTILAEAPVGSPDDDSNLIGGPIHGIIDPLLAPLADNGGPALPGGSRLLTHALMSGSPASDAGNSALSPGVEGTPEFDQRGAPFTRLAGQRVDIGAVERQAPGGALNPDFTLDGFVDGSDFLAWQRGFGKLPATIRNGDATADGGVDGNDLAVWKSRFGNDGMRPAVATTAAISTAEAFVVQQQDAIRFDLADAALQSFSTLSRLDSPAIYLHSLNGLESSRDLRHATSTRSVERPSDQSDAVRKETKSEDHRRGEREASRSVSLELRDRSFAEGTWLVFELLKGKNGYTWRNEESGVLSRVGQRSLEPRSKS